MGAEFVNLDNARHEEQRRVMEGIIERGECPFDEENLAKTHSQPILRRGEHWTVTPNQWPYAFTRLHLLAISRYHAESLSDLQEGSLDELQNHFQWAEAEYQVAAGGLIVAMRFGDVQQTGATVNHIHAHLIVPDKEKQPEDKIRFKIS